MKQREKIKKAGRRNSIKVKLVIMPLVAILLVIAGITAITSYFTREGLLKEMKENGLATSDKFIDRMEDNINSVELINDMLDDKIRSTANAVQLGKDSLSNAFIAKVAAGADVDQMNRYNAEGKIIYSNVPENVGFMAEEGHPVYDFIKGNASEFMEEIRQDSVTGEPFKFGCVRDESGDFTQVGISADNVQKLTDSFSYQRLIDDMVSDEWIEYAMFIDKDLVATAHSNPDERGTVFNDEGAITAVKEKKPYARPWFYELGQVTVYDVCYPVVINGEHVGAVSIGYSMGNIEVAIQKNIISASIAALIGFMVIGFVLYRSSNDAIRVINKLEEQMGFMAASDFSNDMPQELLDKTDEFGEISRAVNAMQNSIKEVIKSVMGASEQLAASSQELTATSQQSAMAADEVAKVISEIAEGALDQAKDTEQGVTSISHLGDLVVQNKDDIVELNVAREKVNTLKDEGLDILKDLVEKTHISSKSSREVQEIIINTNESADKIVSASGMIQSIAEQTNLLALNAAIEAARAGDSGKGFAVVAEEIRKLAEQSNQFTGEISTIINDLIDKTSSGVKTMEELEEVVNSQSESVEMTNNKFDGIAESIEAMQQLMNRVSGSSDEMAHKKEEITGIMEQLSAISEENAAGTQEAAASVEEQTASMEEIASSSEELAKIAEELSNRVGQFKI